MNDLEKLFGMHHMLNSMTFVVSTSGENVWYVDLGSLNHVMHHGE